MAALVWLVAGILLAAIEVATGDFFLLMLAGGALAAAGFAGFAGDQHVAQALVFGVVSIGLVVGVRPQLLRRVRRGEITATNASALVGKEAIVLQRIDGGLGQVKLSGEVWTARSYDDGQALEVGRTVRVMEIDGATAVVWGGV